MPTEVSPALPHAGCRVFRCEIRQQRGGRVYTRIGQVMAMCRDVLVAHHIGQLRVAVGREPVRGRAAGV